MTIAEKLLKIARGQTKIYEAGYGKGKSDTTNSLPTETWVMTLEDGSTVTKEVIVRE